MHEIYFYLLLSDSGLDSNEIGLKTKVQGKQGQNVENGNGKHIKKKKIHLKFELT
jgi:hypothetical protein